jgi:predicted flap endonuclease-1-like 5' DNA nuclease
MRSGVVAEQAEQAEQTLAAFLFENGEASRRFLTTVEKIDEMDRDVRIVDAAIADRTRQGRVKVHQTEDRGGAKGGVRGGTIGVVVGAILLGPAGAVVGGAAGGILAGLHNRFHDIGVDDKFMREVAKEMEKGRSALFVLYEGRWAASIGLVEEAVKAEGALLIQSTLPAETAAALQQLVAPAVEELGGEDVVADYEVDTVEEAADAPEPAGAEDVDDLTRILGIEPETATVLQAAGVTTYARLAATSEPDLRSMLSGADAAVPRNVNTWAMQASFAANADWAGLEAYVEESQAEPVVPAAAASSAADDLTQLAGIGTKSARALTAAGMATYASLAEANEQQVRKALLEASMLPPGDVATWPSQAAYAAKGDWQGLTKYNAKHPQRGAGKPKAASTPASSAPAQVDDLTQLSGIGPRMSSILADAGVTSYGGLQHTSGDELRRIVSAAGVLPPSSLDTWPTQASYAVKGDWNGLAEYNRRRQR